MLRAFLLAFTSIFVALDIFGLLPMYAAVTGGLEPRERDRITDTSVLVAGGVAIAFIFGGEAVFSYLGITLFDFEIAGGLILLLLSLADLVSRPEAETRGSGSTGIVPLAVPLITGPGVLTALVLQSTTHGLVITLAALLANYVLAWALLRRSQFVARLLGKDGATVLSKIAALLLAAFAISMIRSGVFEAIRAFHAGG